MLICNRPDEQSRMADLLSGDGLNVDCVDGIDGDLMAMAENSLPDVIVVDTPSPNRSLIARLETLRATYPCPIAIIADEADSEQIAAAVGAGINGFMTGVAKPGNLSPLIDMAAAQFNETEKLTLERDQATLALAERKTIERAKGIVMKQRGLDEDAAYKFLRQAAMDRNVRLGQLAETILQTEELLN